MTTTELLSEIKKRLAAEIEVADILHGMTLTIRDESHFADPPEDLEYLETVATRAANRADKHYDALCDLMKFLENEIANLKTT